VLLIYLLCSQIPLFGIVKQSSEDPLYWTRVILASNKGTLMELGISPSITAGMVMQLLVGSKLIELDQTLKEDKAIFNGAQKLLGILIGFGEAVAYVWGGSYGELDKIGAGNAILIIIQLTFAGVVVVMLDELLQNGYGIGSAISLFIATNISETILWKAFSPISMGDQYEGAIVALFHLLISKSNKLEAIQIALFRSNAPSLMNLFSTLAVFCVVIYFQGFKIDLAVHNTKLRNHTTTYPIKLFYTSNTPIILLTALISNLFFVSQILFKKLGSFFIIRLLGRWKEVSFGGPMYPVSGLVYYLSPPRSIMEIVTEPIHTLVYCTIILGACALFSRYWIEISGNSPSDVADNLEKQGMTVPSGRPVELKRKLKKYIPTAATFGGICIGALTILADFLGAIGSGIFS
jgi:protein transport protein SEC61 subunit alpha